MNIVEFVKAVRKMRSAQKAYFKTGLQSDLVAARQLEAVVDKALADGVILRVQENISELTEEDKAWVDNRPLPGEQEGLDLSGSQRPTDAPPPAPPHLQGQQMERGEKG
jgi:hypothetical protein